MYNMKILVICSANSGQISPFIMAQGNSLIKHGIDIKYYLIMGKGAGGYLFNYLSLRKCISEYNPDIIHAHYGLSGLLSVLQRKIPVVITFHGSDINIPQNVKYSYLASRLSDTNIFVHPDLPMKINFKTIQEHIIPCGVNIGEFYPKDKYLCRKEFGFELNKKYILFSSRFDNEVKNYPLAKKAFDLLNNDVVMIELKGYNPHKVNSLMSMVDLLLVTSHSETGPLVVKEAMACNCPIVTTNVGDVKWVLGETDGCYITSFDPDDVASKIEQALKFGAEKGRTQGRKRIIELGLDSETVAKRIIGIYENVIDIQQGKFESHVS